MLYHLPTDGQFNLRLFFRPFFASSLLFLLPFIFDTIIFIFIIVMGVTAIIINLRPIQIFILTIGSGRVGSHPNSVHSDCRTIVSVNREYGAEESRVKESTPLHNHEIEVWRACIVKALQSLHHLTN